MAQRLQPKEKKRLLITLAILLVLGTALGLLVHRERAVDWKVLMADILFAQAMAVLLWGVVWQLGNMRMFTSASYGFRRFHEVIRGKQMKSGEMKEDYYSYRESRPYHP